MAAQIPELWVHPQEQLTLMGTFTPQTPDPTPGLTERVFVGPPAPARTAGAAPRVGSTGAGRSRN